MLLPLLSEYDPAERSEGSIDPLGTYAIADALAVRLVPGVRERQSVPRFLTATAVSRAVCEGFGTDALAADGVSEPWQVFEWYVVEGLVRTLGEETQLRGVPGREKARSALEEGASLSADRYLKTPSVFGFHGIYRILARDLGVEQAGVLGELGYRLLTTWVEEQGLPGFYGIGVGEGAQAFMSLRDAVVDGLKKGAVARSGGWRGWELIARHLAPHDVGPREAALLRERLTAPGAGYRAEVLRSLVADPGRQVWTETGSEREFHAQLRSGASPALRDLIDAIQAYEDFVRLLQDAFDDCRWRMSQWSGKTAPAALADTRGVRAAAKAIPARFVDVRGRLEPFELALRFETQFESLAEPLAADDWAVRLIDHHQRIQRGKPPRGKAPWIERFDDGAYILRPPYRVEEGGPHDGSYVNAYRAAPLWSFAQDLRMVV